MSYSSQNEYTNYNNNSMYYTWNDISKRDASNACSYIESYLGNRDKNYPNSHQITHRKKCDGTVNYSKNLYCWEGVL